MQQILKGKTETCCIVLYFCYFLLLQVRTLLLPKYTAGCKNNISLCCMKIKNYIATFGVDCRLKLLQNWIFISLTFKQAPVLLVKNNNRSKRTAQRVHRVAKNKIIDEHNAQQESALSMWPKCRTIIPFSYPSSQSMLPIISTRTFFFLRWRMISFVTEEVKIVRTIKVCEIPYGHRWQIF